MEELKEIAWANKEEVNGRLKKEELHKGKFYIEVSERIKGFWELYPNGRIETKLIDLNETYCLFRAEVYDGDKLMASGYAQEEKSRSGVNATSNVENCETSAVGRALGMLGIGLTSGLASLDEIKNAEERQGIKCTKEQAKFIKEHSNELLEEFKNRKIKYESDINNLSVDEADELIRLVKHD